MLPRKLSSPEIICSATSCLCRQEALLPRKGLPWRKNKASNLALMAISSNNPEEANSRESYSQQRIKPWNTFCAFNVLSPTKGRGASAELPGNTTALHCRWQSRDQLSPCLCSRLGVLGVSALSAWAHLSPHPFIPSPKQGQGGLWLDQALYLCSRPSHPSLVQYPQEVHKADGARGSDSSASTAGACSAGHMCPWVWALDDIWAPCDPTSRATSVQRQKQNWKARTGAEAGYALPKARTQHCQGTMASSQTLIDTKV